MKKPRFSVRAMIAVWLMTLLWTSPAHGEFGAHAHDGVEGGVEPVVAASVGCPATISCGVGCTAHFSNGFCTEALDWEGGIGVGSLQIGPKVHLQCGVCECWYVYQGAAGNRFKRMVEAKCSVTTPGLELF